jgi:Luciferase-like monooxygenase
VLRVAVKLPPAPGRIGDYLADVTALEAAGADSIWLDATNKTSTEAWIHLGAIAAVTHRVRLGMTVGPEGGWMTAADTLGRLSSGRVVVALPPGHEPDAYAHTSILIICATHAEAERAAAVGNGVIVRGGEEEVRALRATRGQDRELEVWVDVPVPADRAAWAQMIGSLGAAGATGIIVPWDPRLIDLLRSAGEPDDRSDLLIATG